MPVWSIRAIICLYSAAVWRDLPWRWKSTAGNFARVMLVRGNFISALGSAGTSGAGLNSGLVCPQNVSTPAAAAARTGTCRCIVASLNSAGAHPEALGPFRAAREHLQSLPLAFVREVHAVDDRGQRLETD